MDSYLNFLIAKLAFLSHEFLHTIIITHANINIMRSICDLICNKLIANTDYDYLCKRYFGEREILNSNQFGTTQNDLFYSLDIIHTLAK